MKASTIVAIILATGAVILATIAFLSKKKKKSLAECGCDVENTDACCANEEELADYYEDVDIDEPLVVVEEDDSTAAETVAETVAEAAEIVADDDMDDITD